VKDSMSQLQGPLSALANCHPYKLRERSLLEDIQTRYVDLAGKIAASGITRLNRSDKDLDLGPLSRAADPYATGIYRYVDWVSWCGSS
jgi:hypothetical protein